MIFSMLLKYICYYRLIVWLLSAIYHRRLLIGCWLPVYRRCLGRGGLRLGSFLGISSWICICLIVIFSWIMQHVRLRGLGLWEFTFMKFFSLGVHQPSAFCKNPKNFDCRTLIRFCICVWKYRKIHAYHHV